MMSRGRCTDTQLLARVPDHVAVGELYERHVDAVFRFAVRRCAQPADVADLVATVFLEMLTSAASFDGRRGNARAWLLGIAVRCLADQRRAGYRHAEIASRLATAPVLMPDEYERVEAMLDAARATPMIEHALAEQLTDAERELFLLVAEDGLTAAEAARALGLTPVAGRMRLARARRKLRNVLDHADPQATLAHEGGRTR